ncbi:MAG: DUF4832 domain-containing protein [Bacteroidales bacterium]|nr:DUF4832 domain-containing protein [Bacteroidales bacterium]
MRKILITLLMLTSAVLVTGQTMIYHAYTRHDSVIANPERGFFHFTSVSSQGSYTPLNLNTLIGYRNQGITVIFRNFYLNGNVSSDLSGDYLAGMEQDFNTLRKAGLKAIIRFSYAESMQKPYGDAPLNVVLRHISQLKPLLQKHSDVILVLQAGFIGAWGEWYYTDYFAFSPGVLYPEHWEMRRQVVNALLDALPAERQIEVRTPDYKRKLLNDTVPISPAEAYSDLPKARIGHHNDCFVASKDDYGTYHDLVKDKDYLQRDSKYTLISGETCNVSSPYSDCPNAQAELARFHWTALNLDYHPSVLGNWRTQGCFETISRKLGYRFYIITSSVQSEAKPGGEFHLVMKLMNEGYSNPVNPRHAEIVLRNLETGIEYKAAVQDDIRFWPLNDTITLDFKAGLPASAPEGPYLVLLNLSDPDPRLYSVPAYSIRMANPGVWEEKTGMNSLQATFNVIKKETLPGYSGTVLFKLTTQEIPENVNITIDGNGIDWANIPSVSEKEGGRIQALKMIRYRDSLFFLVKGLNLAPGYQLFIDADMNPVTGYSAWQWSGNGSDYLIENGFFYSYSGSSHEWNWQQAGTVKFAQNDSVIEFGFPLASLNQTALATEFSIAFVDDPQGTPDYLPEFDSPFAGTMLPLPGIPELRINGWNDKALLYWQGAESGNVYTAIERSENGGEFKKRAILTGSDICFLDTGLNQNSNYLYKLYRLNEDNFSAAVTASPAYTGRAVSDFIAMKGDGDSTDWTIIPPVATCFTFRTVPLRMAYYADSVYISFLGVKENDRVKVFLNTDRDVSTGNINPATGTGGYDCLLYRDSLFIASAGNWVFGKKVRWVFKDGLLELTALSTDLNLNNSVASFVAGVINDTPIPDYAAEAVFYKPVTPARPANFAVLNSQATPYSKIIIQWSRSGDATGYVIERSVGDKEHFTELVRLPASASYFHDTSVDTFHLYYYRMFAYNGMQRSDYTFSLGGKPGSIIEAVFSNLTSEQDLRIFPNPVTDQCFISLSSAFTGHVNVTLYDLSGREIVQVYNGNVNGPENISFRRNNLLSGLYLVRAVDQKGTMRLTKLIIQ